MLPCTSSLHAHVAASLTEEALKTGDFKKKETSKKNKK